MVRLLVRETGDSDLRLHFGLAESLHINFDEAWLERDEIEDYLSHVERLVSKLDVLVKLAHVPSAPIESVRVMLGGMTTARTGHYSDLSAEDLRKARAHLS